MKVTTPRSLALRSLVALLVLAGCSNPTLVEIARRRQANSGSDYKAKDDVTVKYSVTDWDVLNFTDEVKRKLANRSNLHMGVRYGSAGTQATLGALAGAAKTFGWATGTASGLGLGATYIFGMGQIFDSKSHAQAYEQAFTAIQAAEATYYFHQLGMGFKQVNGRSVVDPALGAPRGDIPSGVNLTPDGESLYYRVSKILKVLNDTLTGKIPDLEDMKEASGEASGSGSPAIPKDSPPTTTPAPTSRPRQKAPTGGSSPSTSSTSNGSTSAASTDSNATALRDWWKPNGTVDPDHTSQFNDWLAKNEGGLDIASFLHNPLYKDDWPKARAALVH